MDQISRVFRSEKDLTGRPERIHPDADRPADDIAARPKNRSIILLIGVSLVLAVASALKLGLILGGRVPFNADEAIIGLMARHILRGEWPIFFYGQAYMGSLDAFLVALSFAGLGESVEALRLVQAFLYLGTIVTGILISKRLFRSWVSGFATGLLLAIPAVNLSLYTTASLGNYAEALLLGNLILLCTLRIADYFSSQVAPPNWLWAGFGILSGIGFWAFGLTLVYSIPASVSLIYLLIKASPILGRTDRGRMHKAGFIAVAGFFIGSAPFWVSAIQNNLSLLLDEFGGAAIAGVGGGGWASQIPLHLLNFGLFGLSVIFGLRPPWEVRWLAFPLLPFVVAFWVGVIIFMTAWVRRNPENRFGVLLLFGVILTLTAGYIVSPFGADPSGRYFLPIMVVMSIFAGGLIHHLSMNHSLLAWGLLLLMLVFHLWGTLETALRNPPGITTQFDAVTRINRAYDEELIAFLQKAGVSRGYTNYWVSYPLAFLSQESLIFIPRLPYHIDFRYSKRDDRYAPYQTLVETSTDIAYITTNHSPLDERLRDELTLQGIIWREAKIGDYQIFYNLSRPIRPAEIGLGITTP